MLFVMDDVDEDGVPPEGETEPTTPEPREVRDRGWRGWPLQDIVIPNIVWCMA